MRKVKILVTGRVQGVYFRMFTQNKAKHFGIKGHARNLSDGRVEIIAEADHGSIENFYQMVPQRPSYRASRSC